MKKLLFAVLFATGSAFATEALIDVSNVRMSQDVTSRRVTVKYDLSITNQEGSSLAGALIRLDVLTNTPSGYVSIGHDCIKSVTGDYSISSTSQSYIPAGTDKTMVWDAKRDFPNQRLSDVKVAVKAYYPGELAFDEWKYLVLNIGADAVQTTTYTWVLTDQNPSEYYSAADAWKYNASAIWFVRCPAGSFMMGAPSTAINYQANRPLHKVTLTQPFFMQIAPISNHQWSRVANYTFAANGSAHGSVSLDALMGSNWYSTRVIDPSSLVGKIRTRSGLNVTIPTEAQWEYACRAGSKGTFAGTDEFFTTDAARNAYYESAFGVPYKTYERSTGWNERVNAWGVAGMHTSIANWCQDTQDAVTAEDAIDPCTRGTSAAYVLRGPWQWGGAATCHDYVSNGGLTHSFSDGTAGARLVVMP